MYMYSGRNIQQKYTSVKYCFRIFTRSRIQFQEKDNLFVSISMWNLFVFFFGYGILTRVSQVYDMPFKIKPLNHDVNTRVPMYTQKCFTGPNTSNMFDLSYYKCIIIHTKALYFLTCSCKFHPMTII